MSLNCWLKAINAPIIGDELIALMANIGGRTETIAFTKPFDPSRPADRAPAIVGSKVGITKIPVWADSSFLAAVAPVLEAVGVPEGPVVQWLRASWAAGLCRQNTLLRRAFVHARCPSRSLHTV